MGSVCGWYYNGEVRNELDYINGVISHKQGCSINAFISKLVDVQGVGDSWGELLAGAANYSEKGFVDTFGEPVKQVGTPTKVTLMYKCADGLVMLTNSSRVGGRILVRNVNVVRAKGPVSSKLTVKQFREKVEGDLKGPAVAGRVAFHHDYFVERFGDPTEDHLTGNLGQRRWVYKCADGTIRLNVKLTYKRTAVGLECDKVFFNLGDI